jgi:hypothetical protein
MRYTAVVQNANKQRSTLTLDIRGCDPHGAFDWCCDKKGLKRVGRIKEQTSDPVALKEIPSGGLTKILLALQKVS